jgi:hypothetical protein
MNGERQKAMKRRHVAITAGAALAAMLFTAGSSSAQTATEITLLHGIPGTTVDISVDGTVVFADVAPGDAEDLSASAGTQLVNVEVIDTSDDSVIITAASLDLPADGNHSLVAHLDASGTPVLSLFENDADPVAAAGTGRLTVRHAAAAPAVNVVVDTATIVANLANGASQAVELAAGPVTGAELTLTNGDPVADIPDFNITENVNFIVYAVGSATDTTISFLSQAVALEAPAARTTTDPGATTTTAPDATTTTTDPNATTTTTDPNATTTTSTTTTTTTTTVAPVPVAVNTGSPLDSPLNTTLIVVALGGLFVTGGAMLARRRVS